MREESRPAIVDGRTGVVSSERNFDRYPFFVANKRKEARKQISVRETVEAEGGRRIQTTWTVMGHLVLGLPGGYDQDIYVGALRLLDEQGGPDEAGRLWYKPYQLVRAAELSVSGRQYERLARSVARVSGTHVYSHQAFYSAKLGRRVSRQGFGLWTEYKYAEHLGRRGSNLEQSYLKFSDAFLESYEHEYMDKLDAAFYMSLELPLSKRLFRLLNERCDSQGTWQVDAMVLRDLVPVGAYKQPSKVREKLGRAHEELKRRGFLREIGFPRMAGTIQAVYELCPRFGRKRLVDLALQSPEGKFAVDLLASYQMSREDAAELVTECGAEQCIYSAEALPNQKNVVNPIGWLKRSIRERWEFQEEAPKRGGSRKPARENNGSSLEIASAKAGEPGEQKAEPIPEPGAEETWAGVLKDIYEEVDEDRYRGWFEGTVPSSLEGERLTLTFPNVPAKEYIESRLGEVLQRTLMRRMGSEKATLRYEVAEGQREEG